MVISIDAELGWGFHDLEEPPIDRIEAARSGWKTLFETLERYEVPATWAVVGHLMLEECDGTHGDHPSVDGWFECNQGYWRERPDLKFGRDLISAISSSETPHEIASHTFSHTLFDDPRVTREIARAELETAIGTAESVGIEYDSFVFPRNKVGYRDLLAEYGFSCYRSPARRPANRLHRSGRKIIDAATSRARLVTPRLDEYGLVDIPASLYLFGFEGWPRDVASVFGGDPIVRQARAGIDRAAETDGIFHVWLHPNNITTRRDERRIQSVVEYAAQQRDESALQIETMAGVASRVRRNE